MASPADPFRTPFLCGRRVFIHKTKQLAHTIAPTVGAILFWHYSHLGAQTSVWASLILDLVTEFVTRFCGQNQVDPYRHSFYDLFVSVI